MIVLALTFIFTWFPCLYAFFLHFKVVVSGLQGSNYPSDLTGQKNVFKQVIGPIVVLILGADVEFDVYPRRGMLRGSSLPPVEVDLKTTALANRFKTEGARLSRSKQNGLGAVYFNPCITLSTRCISAY